MFATWYNLAMLVAESQQVMWLRFVRVAAGGPGAVDETNLMVTEKVAAATDAAVCLMMGCSPDHVVSSYRQRVNANARRLSQ